MNSSKEYLISAIVPTYGAGRFMRGLLEDLEGQTIADRMEIVIVDTCSPTDEGAIVKEFQQRYDNILYIRIERRESSHSAINRCIRAARGKYLTLACTDDRHKKDALERMAAVLGARPDIALVYANSYITTEENETFEKSSRRAMYRWTDFDPLQLHYGCYIGPQPMWRKDVHEQYGYFDESLESAGDWDFWLRMAERETFLHVDEFLGLYLYSPNSSEHRDPELSLRECMVVQQRHLPRQVKLLEAQKKIMAGEPVISGALVLLRQGMGEVPPAPACMDSIRRSLSGHGQCSMRVVREDRQGPEKEPGVKVSPSTPILMPSLQQGIEWEARYVALLSPDVLVTRSWLHQIMAVADSDPAIAAVGPVSDVALAPQRIEGGGGENEKDLQELSDRVEARYGKEWKEVPCLGTFCLLLKAEAIRRVGGINERLSLPVALWDLYCRLRSGGFKLACAQGIYVHRGRSVSEEDDRLNDLRMTDEKLCLGERQFHEGRFEEAEETIKSVLKNHPEHCGARSDLACLFWQADRVEEALQELLKVLEIVPDHRDAIWNLGQILKGMSRDAEAHQIFSAYLERHPEEKEMAHILCQWEEASTDST